MYSRGSKYFGDFFLPLPAIAILAFVPFSQQRVLPDSHDSFSFAEPTNKLCGTYGVYLNRTSKCYPWGSKGPCGELMVVSTANFDLGLGRCDCVPPNCGSRPAMFIREKNRCYYIFDQGPCAEGQWLVPSPVDVPNCQNIPCPNEYNQQIKPVEPVIYGVTDLQFMYEYVFPYKNKCYIAGNPTHTPCSNGQPAHFDTSQISHLCTFVSCAGGTSEAANRCPSGEEADIHGGCEPQTDFK